MQLTASLNWNQLVTDPDTGAGRWVIQPKWECPVLDFNEADITLPITGSGSVAKGMWHQYGSIPRGPAGITLSVQDVPGSDSLRDLLGIETEEIKLGRVSEEGKEISEAIVAIPFVDQVAKDYFNINRQTIDWAEAILKPPPTFHSDNASYWVDRFVATKKPFKIHKPAQSVLEMVKKMRKYVIPPRFDFLTNKSIKPLAMVIFEFTAQLSQQDLVNIWQNLPPTSLSTIMTGSQATISLDLLRRYESFDGDPTGDSWKGFSLLNERAPDNGPSPFPSKIQWLVFKVKKKAKTNYFGLTAKNEKSEAQTAMGFDPTFKGTPPPPIPNYSFNWPYDFFSLVELAKIDSTYKLEPHPSLVKDIAPSKISLEEALDKGEDASENTEEITNKEKELTMGQQTGVGWDKNALENVDQQGGAVDKPAGGAGSGKAGKPGGVY